MCGHIGPRMGMPLEEQDILAMPLWAQKFWEEFFAQADREIKAAKEKGEPQPFTPSQAFRDMHTRAITEFGGGIYCPVRQLEQIFNFFNAPN